MDFQSLATIVRELRHFGRDAVSSRTQLEQQITLARSVIRYLDHTCLLQRGAPLEDQVLIVSRLQDLAYYEPDSGGIRDIANWCVGQWLRLLQLQIEDVRVLQGLSYTSYWEQAVKTKSIPGLGEAWLLRSQTSLAKIQLEEGSSSTGTCSDEDWSTSYDSFDETADFIHATTEANARRHTSDYVEARGTLIPATEYFTRAVNLAERQGGLGGHLLSLVSV